MVTQTLVNMKNRLTLFAHTVNQYHSDQPMFEPQQFQLDGYGIIGLQLKSNKIAHTQSSRHSVPQTMQSEVGLFCQAIRADPSTYKSCFLLSHDRVTLLDAQIQQLTKNLLHASSQSIKYIVLALHTRQKLHT